MELFKLVIAFLSGIILPALTEHFKIFLSNLSKRNQLQESLYREIIEIHSNLKEILDHCSTKGMQLNVLVIFLNKIRTKCYDFAQREPLFYQELSEAVQIDILYNNLEEINKSLPTKEKIKELDNSPDGDLYFKNILVVIMNVLKVFESKVYQKRINRKLLQKILNQYNGDDYLYIKGLVQN